MVAQTTSQTNIPEFGWSPKKLFLWWMTPRATERDERFRERVLRFSILLQLSVTTIIIPVILILLTNGEVHNYGSIGVLYGFTIITIFLTYRGYRNSAAWVLLTMLLGLFLYSTVTYGLWLNLSLLALGTTSVYGHIILPRNHIRYLLLLVFSSLFATLFIPQPIPQSKEFLSTVENFTVPTVSFSISLLFLVIVNATLLVLRREFDIRSYELRGFVNELDQRVRDRTQELEIARQKAEEANVIKTKFLANMSHELRTPLNAILNFTAFVADGIMGDVNEEQEDALRQSISSGKHLLALINDILDVTKIEAGLMDLFIQPIDFNEVLGAVVAIGKGLAKDKQIDLVTEIQDKMPISYGDKRRMRQVFLNIVSNAFKFTVQGSITIEAHATDTHIHVKITDTGVGIAPENYDMVFESFKQVQHDSLEVVGTGLGMPISKYFVESHHGKIWFESQVRVGTTFFVELPILTEEQANALRLEVL